MNVNAINEYSRAGGIGLHTKSGEEKAQTVADAFENAIIASSQRMSSTDVARTGISGISESVAAIEESLKMDAQVAKDNLKALFNKLSGAEAVAFDEEGWDLNDMDSEEILTVVDRIKIMLATYCENYQVMSGDVDRDMIEEAVGDAALASKVVQKLSGTYVPSTRENVEEVTQAMDMASRIPEQLSDNAVASLIRNGQEPTIENIYKACHTSGESGHTTLSQEQLAQLLPQMDKIIERAGLTVNETSREEATWLIEQELALTPENLLKLDDLRNFEFAYDEDAVLEQCVNALSDGKRAQEAVLTNTDDPAWKAASEAAAILNQATAQDVEAVTSEYGSLTIARLSFSMTSIEGYMAANYSVEVSQAVVTNNRILNEARLMLTAYSGKVLINSGIDIFNEDLGNIAQLLHESQVKYVIDDFSKKEAGSVSESDIQKTSEFWDALNVLRFMPSAAIGTVMSAEVTVSVATLQFEGGALQQRYEQAGFAYDTMSTKVRSDMGDNLKKAVEASAGDILEELGLEETKENVRCVRILAANSMEMTEENIFAVKELDTVLNQIMDQITPDTVLEMIRDDINPMEADIRRLNQYMEEKQEDTTDEIEKFSEFLYCLDRDGSITPQEREKFIGVYKMFNMFKKDAGKAIGALVNQGADITMENLVMAINSRKNYNMDVKLEENAGMAEVVGKAAYFNTLFSSLGKKLTPELLKNAQEQDFDKMSLEHFSEMVDEASTQQQVRAQYYQEELERMSAYTEAEDEIIRMLTDYDLPVSFHHLMAAEGLNKRGNELFNQFFEDEDGEVREDLEGLVEALETEEEAKAAYDKLKTDVDEAVRKMLSGESSEKLDLNQMRYLTEGIHLMGTLCAKHDYIIPFETENGTAMMNVKLLSDGASYGKIRINVTYADNSQTYLECSAQDKTLEIFAMEQESGVTEDVLTAGLAELGYEKIMVNRVQSDKIVQGAGSRQEQVTTPLLYRTAKQIVKNLMAAESK